jgi:hypothetical protein
MGAHRLAVGAHRLGLGALGVALRVALSPFHRTLRLALSTLGLAMCVALRTFGRALRLALCTLRFTLGLAARLVGVSGVFLVTRIRDSWTSEQRCTDDDAESQGTHEPSGLVDT